MVYLDETALRLALRLAQDANRNEYTFLLMGSLASESGLPLINTLGIYHVCKSAQNLLKLIVRPVRSAAALKANYGSAALPEEVSISPSPRSTREHLAIRFITHC